MLGFPAATSGFVHGMEVISLVGALVLEAMFGRGPSGARTGSSLLGEGHSMVGLKFNHHFTLIDRRSHATLMG